MLIPTSEITDWRDLQNKAAMLFREMGYIAHSPYTVDLAGRGRKEIDVYIVDPRKSVRHVIIVECKYWSSPVPQEIVHSMHFIMQACGANTGLIVSTGGFQSGAAEAASHSNILLMTWDALQRAYGHEWFLRQQERLNPLKTELHQIDGLYLDQWETIKTISNTMRYKRMGRLFELYDILAEGRLVRFAILGGPKSYDQPGPIQVSAVEGYPGAVAGRYGLYVIPLKDVRSYFEWAITQAEHVIKSYEKLSTEVTEAFEALDEKEIGKAFTESFEEMTEEKPIRLLKELVGADEYRRLLALLRTDWLGGSHLAPQD